MTGFRLIAGSGRSGTTWVLDALAEANGLRPVFEPLHPYLSEIGRRYAHTSLMAGEEHPELERFLTDVANGRAFPLWTKYRRQMRWLLPPPAEFSTKRDAGRVWRQWGKFLREAPHLAAASWRREPIVKCIRANLMLDWISRGRQWRVVLILRHPGAVIESELQGSWNANFALEKFRNDSRLHEFTQGRYQRLLERPKTPIESLAARWVIENQWIAECAQSSGVTVVHYEQLRDSPEPTWARIVSALALRNAPDALLLAKPSQQSSVRNGQRSSVSRQNKWQRLLDAGQIDSVQRVLDEAECDLYSMSNPNPVLTAAGAQVLEAKVQA
jgi:hypothetical protein